MLSPSKYMALRKLAEAAYRARPSGGVEFDPEGDPELGYTHQIAPPHSTPHATNKEPEDIENEYRGTSPEDDERAAVARIRTLVNDIFLAAKKTDLIQILEIIAGRGIHGDTLTEAVGDLCFYVDNEEFRRLGYRFNGGHVRNIVNILEPQGHLEMPLRRGTEFNMADLDDAVNIMRMHAKLIWSEIRPEPYDGHSLRMLWGAARHCVLSLSGIFQTAFPMFPDAGPSRISLVPHFRELANMMDYATETIPL